MSSEFAQLAKQAEEIARKIESEEALVVSRETGSLILRFFVALCRRLDAQQETEADE